MKKMLKSALALAMGAVMLMPVTAFAAEDEPTPHFYSGSGFESFWCKYQKC